MSALLLISMLFIKQSSNPIKDSDHLVWVGFSLKPLIARIAQQNGDRSAFSSPADDKTVALARYQALKDFKPAGPGSPENDTTNPSHSAFIRGRKITERQHWTWFLGQLHSLKAVKIGMTREVLLEIVGTEGGISSRYQQTFVSKGCPELKIDVRFKGQPGAFNLDTVSQVSIPHIDFMVLD